MRLQPGNPKKNYLARRVRPTRDGSVQRSVNGDEQTIYGFKGGDPSQRSRSKYHPHQGAGEIARREARMVM